MSYKEAIETQRRLASRVRFTIIRKKPKIIAGLDCAFSKDGKKIIAVVVVLKSDDFAVIETATVTRKVTFPYIPGLLSFREAPACIGAIEKIKTRPDVFIVDGQGLAHPRRFGIASHIGVLVDRPTVGCAKGRIQDTGQAKGQI